MSYFDFDKGTYIKDHEKVFSVSGDQFFTIKDNWDSYDKVRPTIDTAHENWSRRNY